MVTKIEATGPGKEPAPLDRIRKVRYSDRKRYMELLSLLFAEDTGIEFTESALPLRIRLYFRLFFLWKFLSLLRCFSAFIPNIFVYEKDGRVVAIETASRRGLKRGPFYLYDLFVDPAFRRIGIASALRSHIFGGIGPEYEHILLGKVRQGNIAMIRNNIKAGSYPYAREMTFSLDLRAWRNSGDAEKAMSHASSPTPGEAYQLCTPEWSEITRLKFRETPEEVRDYDPATVLPFGRPRGLGTILSYFLFPSSRWKSGIRENGDLVASAVPAYHRRRKTWEIYLSALPGYEDAVLFLLKKTLNDLAGRRRVPVLVSVRDYQKPIIGALESFNFSLKDEYVCFCHKIPKKFSG